MSVQHYCNVQKFYERNRPDILKVYNEACLNHQIQNQGTKYGYTFLLPPEAEVKKISDLQAKGDDASFVQAARLINALGVKAFWAKASDAAAMKTTASNFNGKLVPIESAAGNKITFKDGVTATKVEEFKVPPTDAMGRPVQLAIWAITKLLPEGGADAPKLPKMDRKMGPPKKGSYEPANADVTNISFALLSLAANEYARAQAMNTMQKSARKHNNAFIKYALDFYHWAYKNNQTLFYGILLPMWVCSPAVFFNVFEPYRVSGEHVVSPDEISKWFNSADRECPDPAAWFAELNSIVESPRGWVSGPAAAEDCKLYDPDTRMKIRIELDKCKVGIKKNMIGASIVDGFKQLYATLDAENRIGSYDKVFPDALAYIYKTQPYLKAIQDEVCYTSYVLFHELECNPFDAMRLNEIVDYIGDLFYIPRGQPDNFEKNMRILKKEKLASLNRAMVLKEINTFVNSSCFMHILQSHAEYKSWFPGKYSTSRVELEDGRNSFFNVDVGANAKWSIVGQSMAKPVADSLAGIMDKLSPAARKELEAIMGQAQAQ